MHGQFLLLYSCEKRICSSPVTTMAQTDTAYVSAILPIRDFKTGKPIDSTQKMWYSKYRPCVLSQYLCAE